MKWILSVLALGTLLVAAGETKACDPFQRFQSHRRAPQRIFVPVRDRGLDFTRIRVGPFGRLRDFEQFNSNGSFTRLRTGPFGRVRRLEQRR